MGRNEQSITSNISVFSFHKYLETCTCKTHTYKHDYANMHPHVSAAAEKKKKAVTRNEEKQYEIIRDLIWLIAKF